MSTDDSFSETEDRLIEAVQCLLAEGGASACSMRAIADRAGVTPGAIYKHFKDKDALVDHVVMRAFEQFELYLLKAILSLPVGSLERLAALGEAYITFAEANPSEFAILFNPLLAERRKLADLPGEGGFSVLRQCVVEAIDAGVLRAADPDLVALFLWSRVHGIVMLTLACDLGDMMGHRESPAVALFNLTRSFMVEGLAHRQPRESD
ncbi:MAG: TetR/AcrR family transcriptional regulator [Gammaproteobacteria bacterium]|nr:TetR/AcrR family transcriptional regulator [Gammaproteobacteria bacterium]